MRIGDRVVVISGWFEGAAGEIVGLTKQGMLIMHLDIKDVDLEINPFKVELENPGAEEWWGY
jgi:ribosomal protein L24